MNSDKQTAVMNCYRQAAEEMYAGFAVVTAETPPNPTQGEGLLQFQHGDVLVEPGVAPKAVVPGGVAAEHYHLV